MPKLLSSDNCRVEELKQQLRAWQTNKVHYLAFYRQGLLSYITDQRREKGPARKTERNSQGAGRDPERAAL